MGDDLRIPGGIGQNVRAPGQSLYAPVSTAFELPFPAAGCTLTTMRKRILSVALGISSLAAAMLAAEVPVSAPSRGASAAGHDDYPFFPFCIDWHDAKKRTFEQQAEMLKELGYPGVGHIWLDKVEERIKTLDAAGLRLFQITMVVDVAPGKTPYDAKRFKEVCALIKGRQVQFCLLLNGVKSSDPTNDPHAVGILREMSDQARDSGAQLLLYPHQNSWVERIEDAVRVADEVNRPNVGVMFNLCHWLRVDKSRDYRPLLKQAMPRLWAVSINGADNFDEKPGWEHYIQPLDKGSFDVGKLLKTLKELGYKGPVGLQCYGIGGDAREHLARSMAAWQKLGVNLKD
jgi:sugar phosphate isomerase/epimerase